MYKECFEIVSVETSATFVRYKNKKNVLPGTKIMIFFIYIEQVYLDYDLPEKLYHAKFIHRISYLCQTVFASSVRFEVHSSIQYFKQKIYICVFISEMM